MSFIFSFTESFTNDRGSTNINDRLSSLNKWSKLRQNEIIVLIMTIIVVRFHLSHITSCNDGVKLKNNEYQQSEFILNKWHFSGDLLNEKHERRLNERKLLYNMIFYFSVSLENSGARHTRPTQFFLYSHIAYLICFVRWEMGDVRVHT